MKKAFTLTETLVVLTVLGVIAAIIISSFGKSDTLRQKKIYAVSQDFYSATVRSYQQILLSKTTNADITKLLKTSGTGTGGLSDLVSYFKTYMDGRDVNCSELKLTTDSIKEYTKSATCLEYSSLKVVAVYKLDTTCKTSVATRNYYDSQNKTATTTSNACGYVIYGFKDSNKGILGEDVFTIALGRRGIK